MLKGKIHRVTVTEANLDYVGSLTLDEDLMNAAGLKEYEKIQVLDLTNGSRIETYVIKSKAGSKNICINGPAAHLIKPNDVVIILSYCLIKNNNVINHRPIFVNVNNQNKISSEFYPNIEFTHDRDIIKNINTQEKYDRRIKRWARQSDISGSGRWAAPWRKTSSRPASSTIAGSSE